MRTKTILIALLFLHFNSNCQESPESNKISIGETIELHSSILGETREIYIYQPEGLWDMDEDMTNLPVIFVLDAESQFTHTATTVDFLSNATNGNDFIPRSLVVGIATNNHRIRDLTPTNDSNFPGSGGGQQFLEFITKELIPYIDNNYDTSNHRTIIGHSMGGLLCFETLKRHRTFFDNYLIIDPASGFANNAIIDELIDTLNHSDLSLENVFLASANNRPMFLSRADLMSDTSRLAKEIDIPNQQFISMQKKSNWRINLKSKIYENENHYSLPHISTMEGLKELFGFYTFPQMTNYYHPAYQDSTLLVEQIKEHYEQVSEQMGYEVKPMQGYLNSFAFGLNHYGREDLAVDLLKYNIELNPKDPIMYNNLGYLYMSNHDNQSAIEIFTESLQLESDDIILQTLKQLKRRN